jgi:hypothetical protein
MTAARVVVLLVLPAVLLAPGAVYALDEPCLSQSEVQGGYKRYHIIGGRQCWYASTSPKANPGAANPGAVKPAPAARADGIDVNPYGDPIWEQADAKPAPVKPRPAARPSAVGGPLVISPAFANPR